MYYLFHIILLYNLCQTNDRISDNKRGGELEIETKYSILSCIFYLSSNQMAEAHPLCLNEITESDMEIARNLIYLSANNITKSTTNKSEFQAMKKNKRYRSLTDIYNDTTPISMFEARNSCNSVNDEITETEMEVAQHLIQLSLSDGYINNDNILGTRNKMSGDEEVDQGTSATITKSTTHRIEFQEKKKKKKKYRSLVDIYKATTPISMPETKDN